MLPSFMKLRLPAIPGLFSALLYSSCMKGEYVYSSMIMTVNYDVIIEHLRLGCDLTHIFFVIDEYTDIENEPGCREMIDMAIDALENPGKPRPEGEIPLGEIIRQSAASLDYQALALSLPADFEHGLSRSRALLPSAISKRASKHISNQSLQRRPIGKTISS